MYQKIKFLAKDTVLYGTFSVVGRLMSFILTPLYSNYLTTSQFDFLIFLFSFTTLLSVLYSMGMEGAYLRFFNQKDENNNKNAFSIAYFSINIVSFFITILIIYFSGYLTEISGYSSIPNARTLIILAAFIPFLDVLSYIPFNYLRIQSKAILLSSIKLAVITVSLVLHFILLSKLNYQAEGAIYSQIAANSLAFLVLIPIILKNLDFSFNKNLFNDMLKFALPTIPAGLAAIILQVADRPILKFLTNSDLEITTYQVNYRLGIPMLIFVSVFDFAWQPFFLKHQKDESAKQLFGRVLTYYTFISALLFLTIVFFMEFFVKLPFPGGTLINSKYWFGLSILPIIITAYFFYGLYVNFSLGVIIEKKTYTTSIALIFAVIVDVVLNFALVPNYGFIGSAYSICGAYFAGMLVMYLFSRKYYKIDYEWKRISIIISSAILIYLLSFLIDNSNFGNIITILIKLSLLIIYILILKIFGFFNKEEIFHIKRLLRIN
jgi:O-antigen/teichoic acid export membrane protein